VEARRIDMPAKCVEGEMAKSNKPTKPHALFFSLLFRRCIGDSSILAATRRTRGARLKIIAIYRFGHTNQDFPFTGVRSATVRNQHIIQH
jgi:hypothetical protein